MTIEAKCSLGDTVRIKALEGADGVCVSIWVTSIGLQYELVYWNDGKREKEYFLEFELTFQGKS